MNSRNKQKILIKIGGSLFYEDSSVINGVIKSLALLNNYYQIYVVVGSGPMGEFYKSLRNHLGINSTDPSLESYKDDKDAWDLIQNINLELLSNLLYLLFPNMEVSFCDNLTANESDYDVIRMVKPSNTKLMILWQGYKDTISSQLVESVNIQKTDIKALLYGNVLGMTKYLILTSVNGIYTADPRKDVSSSIIKKLLPEDLKDIEFTNRKATCLDRGISLLMKEIMPNDTEIGVLSYEAFISWGNTNELKFDNIYNILKLKGTWISNNIIMQ